MRFLGCNKIGSLGYSTQRINLITKCWGILPTSSPLTPGIFVDTCISEPVSLPSVEQKNPKKTKKITMNFPKKNLGEMILALGKSL